MSVRHKGLFLITCTSLISLLIGCAGGTADSGGGNPAVGVGVVNLTSSKLGNSGGFVDVNGDGAEDRVVGAPAASGPPKTGAIVVYHGTGSGFSSSYSTFIRGENEGDSFGYSFANVGDVDGDGKADFAVGAINAESLSGAVYIYKGGSNGQTLIKKLSGEGPRDKFGFSIASADLNNDGKKDIIIGALFNTNDPALFQQGAVYVNFGPDFSTKAALYASTTNKGLGWMVAAGDVNNDNVPDLLISAGGKVLVYYGGSSFNPKINSPDLTITSSASGFGKTIAVTGDINGDGFKDIAIGAPNASINSNRDTGSVYIVKGGTGTRTVNVDSSPSDLIVRIGGTNLFDRFGSSIAVVDADGDNLIDIAIGAPLADVDSNLMAGKVYLFKGKDIGTTTTLSNATVFKGNARYQGYGTFLAAAPNKKLLVGAPSSKKYSGEFSIVDLTTGETVPDGGAGGTPGGGDDHQH